MVKDLLEPKAYSAYCKDKNVLLSSSSGGVFYLIVKYFINNLNGVVYGVSMDGIEANHIRINDVKDIIKIQRSKYVQSNVGSTFKECENDLLKGLYVVYSGTPCQINSLINYLEYKKINTSKLLAIDFICHGMPEKKYWMNYVSEFNLKNATNFNFRDKRYGWEDYCFSYTFKNKKIMQPYSENPYMHFFLKNYILKTNCYQCDFKNENRRADLTLGDFWGVKSIYPSFYNKLGTSLLLVRNSFVLNIILNLQSLVLNEVDYSLAVFKNESYSLSATRPDDYEKIVSNINMMGFKASYDLVKRKKSRACFKRNLFKFLSAFNIKKYPSQTINDKDIGIISDFGYSNFGNKLQNYALRSIISSQGFNPVDIILDNNRFKVFGFLLNFINKIKLLIKRPHLSKKQNVIKKAALLTGEKTYSFAYIDKKNYGINNFKAIIVGSDQVWNWTYHRDELPFYLGCFGFDYTGRMYSYAASIGCDIIEEKYELLFKEHLKTYSKITVREQNAKTILNKYGLESFLACDPTLLLKCNEWDRAIDLYSSIELPKCIYAFKYCLKTNDEEYDGYLLDALDKKSKYYYISHFDFINLIKNSHLVITDSYHAFIFSIIFKKKVKLICREEMFARFDVLFKKLNIMYDENKIIDFGKIDCNQLMEFARQSGDYLKGMLCEKY